MHAEATSEKVAMGWFLDGRVTAVVGTHTHVPTADARVLPGGTAYITDVGMTGARGGVIGVKREQSIAVFRSHMPMRYDASDEDPWLMAVVIRTAPGSRPSRAESIETILRPGEQRDERERQEPDEVEVEPVLQRELERDQRRRAERGDADRVAAARDEGDDHGEDERGGERERGGRGGRRAPRPRTASRGRPGSRACGRRTCPSPSPSATGASASAATAAKPAAVSASARRGGRRRRSRTAAPARSGRTSSARPRRSPRRARRAARATSIAAVTSSATRPSLAFEFATSSVNGNAAHA